MEILRKSSFAYGSTKELLRKPSHAYRVTKDLLRESSFAYGFTQESLRKSSFGDVLLWNYAASKLRLCFRFSMSSVMVLRESSFANGLLRIH